MLSHAPVAPNQSAGVNTTLLVASAAGRELPVGPRSQTDPRQTLATDRYSRFLLHLGTLHPGAAGICAPDPSTTSACAGSRPHLSAFGGER